MSTKEEESSLIDPSLLEGLSPEERAEALAAAAAAKRAEERAEQRALERAMARKEAERKTINATAQSLDNRAVATSSKLTANPKIKFVSKRQRQNESTTTSSTKESPTTTTTTASNGNSRQHTSKPSPKPPVAAANNGNSHDYLSAKERKEIRQTYLGKHQVQAEELEQKQQQQQQQSKKRKKDKSSKKSIFRFEWDNQDDTLDQSDPLYNPAATTKTLTTRRKHTDPLLDEDASRPNGHRHGSSSVHTKPLAQMTPRDWRIYRENFEISIKGGRAPPPLRSFREAQLHPALMQAIQGVLRYQEPTPIQRQAIPIGLQRRDLIGIAETGSGKTAAFGVPLLQYLLQLSPSITNRVAEDGPLALVLAPTRELALQIHGEFLKLLSKQSHIKAAAVVGGQSIQHQAQELRDGVHVVVGTPGRINDCIEMAYMVLNKCCYIVLDEGDRMIDMGFAPQMESILDAMGGLLKSENEQEAYQQEEEDRLAQTNEGVLPRHRLTALFSATMPLEVERMAKRYLRHPAVISIGDQDSSKNHRIKQRIIFLSSPSHKEKTLRELILNPRYLREKVIVFVNEKKHADGVGRMVERTGRTCVVLHGGKSQEQREDALQKFRNGGVVLVATDVAGRGLDIPNVAHVINYDLPSRSIDNYSHRIGRTGRAGREGLATSLLTDEDEGIMAPLKQYLESTGQLVPDKLARHPAANANNAQGNLIY